MAATCFSSLNVEKWKKRGRVDCNVSLELEIFQTLYLKLVIYPKKRNGVLVFFLRAEKSKKRGRDIPFFSSIVSSFRMD